MLDIRIVSYSVSSASRAEEVARHDLVARLISRGLTDLAVVHDCSTECPVTHDTAASASAVASADTSTGAGYVAVQEAAAGLWYSSEAFDASQVQLPAGVELGSIPQAPCAVPCVQLRHKATGTQLLCVYDPQPEASEASCCSAATVSAEQLCVLMQLAARQGAVVIAAGEVASPCECKQNLQPSDTDAAKNSDSCKAQLHVWPHTVSCGPMGPATPQEAMTIAQQPPSLLRQASSQAQPQSQQHCQQPCQQGYNKHAFFAVQCSYKQHIHLSQHASLLPEQEAATTSRHAFTAVCSIADAISSSTADAISSGTALERQPATNSLCTSSAVPLSSSNAEGSQSVDTAACSFSSPGSSTSVLHSNRVVHSPASSGGAETSLFKNGGFNNFDNRVASAADEHSAWSGDQGDVEECSSSQQAGQPGARMEASKNGTCSEEHARCFSLHQHPSAPLLTPTPSVAILLKALIQEQDLVSAVWQGLLVGMTCASLDPENSGSLPTPSNACIADSLGFGAGSGEVLSDRFLAGALTVQTLPVPEQRWMDWSAVPCVGVILLQRLLVVSISSTVKFWLDSIQSDRLWPDKHRWYTKELANSPLSLRGAQGAPAHCLQCLGPELTLLC